MALIARKARVDQLAKQYGGLPSTVEGWRDAALLAIEQAMTMSASTPKERELEAKEGVHPGTLALWRSRLGPDGSPPTSSTTALAVVVLKPVARPSQEPVPFDVNGDSSPHPS